MKIHFIAIGGSAMHNLAIALKREGHRVTGSDDEIFEPSKGRLKREGLLPEFIGWHPEKITADLDAVVLGMHARADNPELARAQELGLEVYSYPEYVYRQTANKQRVVIGGSHGKTTITAILLHVMRKLKRDVDYLVGAQLEGYDCMVKLSDAPLAIIEGDEYLSSPTDRRPKFHLYRPHIALLSGIAWDHINVFETEEIYVRQFETFIDLIESNGNLVYYRGDERLRGLAEGAREDIKCTGYGEIRHTVLDGRTYLHDGGERIPIELLGGHNMQNLAGALAVAQLLGVSEGEFKAAVADFAGASNRLEKLGASEDSAIYKDFAHAPSKLKATTAALKAQYPDRRLVACMELHTFSSLNKKFLPQYRNAMAEADRALVYFSPKVVAHKKLDPIDPADIQKAFGTDNVEVFTDSSQMLAALLDEDWSRANLLLMSSGNFDGLDFAILVEAVVG